MTNLEVFGPIVDATVIERAFLDLLKDWLSTYLAEIEDRTPGLEKGTIVRPKSWQSDIDAREFPETQLPAIAVIVGSEDPESDGQFLHSLYGVEVGAIVKGASRQQGRDVARWYATAIKLAVTHQLTRQGGPVQDVTYEGADWGETAGNPGKVAAVSEVAFTVLVPATMDLLAGPNQPSPEPVPPGNPPGPDGWPTYPSDPTVTDDETVNPSVDAIPVPADQEFTP